MRKYHIARHLPVLLLIVFKSALISASTPSGRLWYVSWGYNAEAWMNNSIHVQQPTLKNDFTLLNVKGHDAPGWTSGIFNKDFTVPQYSIRIGCFLNAAHSHGIELNIDHTKYTVTENQLAHISGIIEGSRVERDIILSPNAFRYFLHNGANHIMINYVQRFGLLGKEGAYPSLQGIYKIGGGIMLPHAENTILGMQNDNGPKSFANAFGFHHGWWRYGGPTTGLEYGLRFHALKWVYLELTSKLAYSRLYNIPVYNGTASHNLWMVEGILSMGLEW